MPKYNVGDVILTFEGDYCKVLHVFPDKYFMANKYSPEGKPYTAEVLDSHSIRISKDEIHFELEEDYVGGVMASFYIGDANIGVYLDVFSEDTQETLISRALKIIEGKVNG